MVTMFLASYMTRFTYVSLILCLLASSASAGTGKTFIDYIDITAVPYTSPTKNIANGGADMSTAAGELCGYGNDWQPYTKQVFAYKATSSRQLEFRTCDANAQTTDFGHIFMFFDCPAKLAFADGKDADQCTCAAPIACGAVGRKVAVTTKANHWYYAVVVATTWASWPYTRQYLLTVLATVAPSPAPPYYGDYVTNPVVVGALPYTSAQQTIALGPYGIPQAIAQQTVYKYDEQTPIRKRIFLFSETKARTLTVKTCVAGALPNFNHLIWVVECPHKLASKDALDSADCSVAVGSSCVGASADWYSMKRSFVTAPSRFYYVLLMAVTTAESDNTNSHYTLALEEMGPAPPAPAPSPGPPPPPPPAPGTSCTNPVTIPTLPYTSPTMRILDGTASISKVVGELCHYNQDWGVYSKQVFAYKETVGSRGVEFRTCDANSETTDFGHILWLLDCPTALAWADGMDASKCSCVDPLGCGATGLSALVATKKNRWYYAIVVATTWPGTTPTRNYLLTAQVKALPTGAFKGDYVTNPVAITAPSTTALQTIALGPYGIPRAIGERTAYRYNEITPIRKRIFLFTETKNRTLTAKTCVPGALANFNHLIWVADCPLKLASKEALDSADCSVAVGSSCVGTSADWYSMKITFPTVRGRKYYIFVIAVNTAESNSLNSLYSLNLAVA